MNAFWKRLLLGWLGLSSVRTRVFALDEESQTALVNLADAEGRPQEELHAELVAEALAQRQSRVSLHKRWRTLSAREQEVAALACLGYTNRQAGARLGISEQTVKTHIHNVLIKFGMHSKVELGKALEGWNFSEWE